MFRWDDTAQSFVYFKKLRIGWRFDRKDMICRYSKTSYAVLCSPILIFIAVCKRITGC